MLRAFSRQSVTLRIVVFAILLASLQVVPARAIGTEYHVNNLSDSNCSNTGSGTIEQPFCDFTPINSRNFGAGDQILLARGATWNQQMTLNSSGTAANRAVLDAYGSGARPRIIRNSDVNDIAIRMNNPSYWNVSNLEIGNAGVGILVWYSTLFHEGLTFSNIFVHDIYGIHQGNYPTPAEADNANCDRTNGVWNSGGIHFTGDVANLDLTATQYLVRDVVIDDLTGTQNQSTLQFDFCNGDSFEPNGIEGTNLVQDVTVNRLYSFNNDGPPGSPAPGTTKGCDEGARFVNVSNLVILNSRFINDAACNSATGTAAILFGVLRNATLINSIVSDVPNTGSPDQTGVDYECCNREVRIRNSFIARNAGPGVEFLAISPFLDYAIDNLISGNLFVNNAQAASSTYRGSIGRIGTSTQPTGTIRDNLYVEPTGFLYASGDANFDGFNIPIGSNTAATDAYYAGEGFGSTQAGNRWSYQFSENGTTWSDLSTYDSTTERWRNSETVPLVGRFEMHPDTCSSCWVGRAWSAPRAGIVSIRASALKSGLGGNGLIVRVTKNNNVIWGPQIVGGNERVGIETILNDVSVQANDVVRFEANNNGENTYDMLSWSPAIAYTEASPVGDLDWDFNAEGNSEGWTPINQLTGSVSGGAYILTASGNDPYAHSADNLNYNLSGKSCIEIRMKNNTDSTSAKLFFITDVSGIYNEAKSFTFVTAPNSNYTTYQVNTTINSSWTSSLRQLRFDPGEATGSYEVDYIRLQTSCAGGEWSVTIANNGFETPVLGANQFQYNPSGASWSFMSSPGTGDSGIARNGSAFGNSNAPEGNQVALLQMNGTFYQDLTGFQVGETYIVSFSAAQRPGNVQSINVTLGSTPLGTYTPTTTNFTTFLTGAFTATATTHRLTFTGINAGGDNTAFIDNIQISTADGGSQIAPTFAP